MERFFGNIEVLATWVYANNRRLFGNRFRPDFYVHHEFNIPKAIQTEVFQTKHKSAISKAKPKPPTVSQKVNRIYDSLSVRSGTVWFYAFGSLTCPKHEWAYFRIGFSITIEPNKKPIYELFVEFEWRGMSRDLEWEDRAASEEFHKFPSEINAQQKFRHILKLAKSRVRRKASSPYREIFESVKMS
jgi:hypothetical protein